MSLLYHLAKIYVTETEAFDALVCPGGRPEEGKHLAMVSHHARLLNDACLSTALTEGYTEKDWNQARQWAIRNYETNQASQARSRVAYPAETHRVFGSQRVVGRTDDRQCVSDRHTRPFLISPEVGATLGGREG